MITRKETLRYFFNPEGKGFPYFAQFLTEYEIRRWQFMNLRGSRKISEVLVGIGYREIIRILMEAYEKDDLHFFRYLFEGYDYIHARELLQMPNCSTDCRYYLLSLDLPSTKQLISSTCESLHLAKWYHEKYHAFPVVERGHLRIGSGFLKTEMVLLREYNLIKKGESIDLIDILSTAAINDYLDLFLWALSRTRTYYFNYPFPGKFFYLLEKPRAEMRIYLSTIPGLFPEYMISYKAVNCLLHPFSLSEFLDFLQSYKVLIKIHLWGIPEVEIEKILTEFDFCTEIVQLALQNFHHFYWSILPWKDLQLFRQYVEGLPPEMIGKIKLRPSILISPQIVLYLAKLLGEMFPDIFILLLNYRLTEMEVSEALKLYHESFDELFFVMELHPQNVVPETIGLMLKLDPNFRTMVETRYSELPDPPEWLTLLLVNEKRFFNSVWDVHWGNYPSVLKKAVELYDDKHGLYGIARKLGWNETIFDHPYPDQYRRFKEMIESTVIDKEFLKMVLPGEYKYYS